MEAEGRLGAAAQQFIAATAAAARRVATLPGEPGGQQGADYARQIASRVSGALVARLLDAAEEESLRSCDVRPRRAKGSAAKGSSAALGPETSSYTGVLQ